MDEVIETVTEAVQEGSAAHEYTAEEIEAQTTEFLLAFIDQLTDISEEGKAKLRNNVLERAMHPELFAEEAMPKKVNVITPQDWLKLIALVMIIVIIFGKIIFNRVISC
ncbi:hypothetical protein PVAND_007886 [Polypedilum vanderplanki]|uniref:Uncharacterized protein n=1 Tax=Polypedilum vanderplanki TaxID=319348 RepID=A0A9J6C7Z8_POLVA|nr:hypothetical protein PVAND_007886 [Polypedilum vanderplanki]